MRCRQSGELARVAHWHASDELVSMVPNGGLWRPEGWLLGLWDNSSILIEKRFFSLLQVEVYMHSSQEVCNQAYTCLFRLLLQLIGFLWHFQSWSFYSPAHIYWLERLFDSVSWHISFCRGVFGFMLYIFELRSSARGADGGVQPQGCHRVTSDASEW